MAQTRVQRSGSRTGHHGGGGINGGPPAHLILMELKHRILAALSKLSDRDTHQLAVEELQRVVEFLTPEGIATCLSCIYDTDAQQKSAVKKECVRMFGTLASVHGQLMLPHLPKIVASVVRRLKDPDSGVREACVEAMGTLSANVVLVQQQPNQTIHGLQHSMQELNAFVKPLFDALSEQNRNVQGGAAMCLARVISTTKGPPQSSSMTRLCQRVCKLILNPSFLAKSALLPVISSLCQVGAVNQQSVVGTMIPCVHEALESHDWATRKSAAETLTRMGSTLIPQLLYGFKPATLLLLESCRFDKVKPVRDSVQDAIQTWKCIQGSEKDSRPSSAASSTPSSTNGSGSGMSTNNAPQEPSRLPNGILKKRSSAFPDKKPNPDFFNKMDSHNQDDWHIEVSVPRNPPPPVSAPTNKTQSSTSYSEMKKKQNAANVEPKENTIMDLKREKDHLLIHSTDDLIGEDSLNTNQDHQYDFHDYPETLSPPEQNHGDSKTMDKNLTMHQTAQYDRGDSSANDHPPWDITRPPPSTITANIMQVNSSNSNVHHNTINPHHMNSHHTNSNINSHHTNVNNPHHPNGNHNNKDSNHNKDSNPHQNVGNPHHNTMNSYGNGNCNEQTPGNWLIIQRQLAQLEFQQASMMELLQEFMGSSRDSMVAMETRIQVMERVMEDIVQDLEAPPMSNSMERYNDNSATSDHPFTIGRYHQSQVDNYNLDSSMARNAGMSALSDRSSYSSTTSRHQDMSGRYQQQHQQHQQQQQHPQHQQQQQQQHQQHQQHQQQQHQQHQQQQQQHQQHQQQQHQQQQQQQQQQQMDNGTSWRTAAESTMDQWYRTTGEVQLAESDLEKEVSTRTHAMEARPRPDMASLRAENESIARELSMSRMNMSRREDRMNVMGMRGDDMQSSRSAMPGRDNDAARGDPLRNMQSSLRGAATDETRDQDSFYSDPDSEQITARRVWERTEFNNPNTASLANLRPGEGPSARNVWQASKDEATLAAIRGASEDHHMSNINANNNQHMPPQLNGTDQQSPNMMPNNIPAANDSQMQTVNVQDNMNKHPEIAQNGTNMLHLKPAALGSNSNTMDEDISTTNNSSASINNNVNMNNSNTNTNANINTSNININNVNNSININANTSTGNNLSVVNSVNNNNASTVTTPTLSTTKAGTEQQAEKRAYWRMWSRIMEMVQSGDMDSAYLDVLGSGDELMLVRLMNKTGPVIPKLSVNTSNELLQTVSQLLRQHSFFDYSLPWIQQVADLIMDMGPNHLDLLSNVKLEILDAIQEVGNMDMPMDWSGNSISELSLILMEAWGNEQEIGSN